MVCIYCGGSTQVTNSRVQKRNNAVWRRRVCLQCAQLFTTLEQADLASSIRIVSANELLPFSRDKLLLDVYDACKHRPKAIDDAQALVRTILADIMAALGEDGTISLAAFHGCVLTVLGHFDAAAATIYRAYR